jgi:hypothetical protein
MWKLYLDDIRYPHTTSLRTKIWWKLKKLIGITTFNHDSEWYVARSSNEAISLIEEKGPPAFISFDHDLSGSDRAIDVCKYLSENYYNSEVDYIVHSENPLGKQNIISYMESWKYSKGLK